jgi:ATP-binding cassette subfamily B protein
MQLQAIEKQLHDMLRQQVVFSILSEEELADLLGHCELENYALGQSIIEAGSVGDCAYLLYSGRVRVFHELDGKPVTLGIYSAGYLFGERAILRNEERAASVRATDDCVVLRIDQVAIKNLTATHPELREYFDQLLANYALQRFLRLATFVGTLPPKQVSNLLERIESKKFSKGEVIFREGDEGDCLYFVRSGEVKISHDVNGEDKLLTYCGEGDYFGELALIEDRARAATVTAMSETECLALARADFDAMLKAAPDIREQIAKKMELYRVDDDMERKFGVRPAELRKRQELAYKPDGQTEPIAAADAIVKPKRGIFRRYPFYRQLDETDCGAASLAMISRYYGVSLRIGKLRDLANVGHEGASLYSLAAAAEKLGYATRAIRTDFSHLESLDLPAIVHWQGYHYIVLYEVKGDRVVVGDPAIGLLKMSRKEFEEGWTGRMLLLTATPTLLGQEHAKTTIGRFLPYLTPYRVLLFEIFLASIILELLQLVNPVFTQMIIDKVLVHQNINMLNLMLGGMIIIGVFQSVTGILRQYLSLHLSQKLGLKLSADLFRQIMRLPMRFFHTRKIGDLLQRFTDNNEIQEVMTGKVISTVLDVFTLVFTLTLMLYYNVKLTGAALIAIPVYILLTLVFTPLLKRNNQRQFERNAESSSSLIETMTSIATVKNLAIENQMRWKYEDRLVKQEKMEFEGARLNMVMEGLSSAVQLFATTFLLWYGAHLVIKGEITVGQLMAFQGLVGMVISPIMGLIGLWDELHQAYSSLQRLADVYEAEPEQATESAGVMLPRLRGSLRLENVSFRYNLDDANILSEVNLDLSPGKTLALVGRSGSGKSTLINLLQRFYLPTEGRILVDGYDIASVDIRSLRTQLGVVPQNPSIFSGTIRENIALSDPEASIERVITAAKIANAHDFVMAFPMGYDTVIGEMGIQLSGGQKQRVSIARALLNDPRILIFDEATSALDTESEKMIQQNLRAILSDRTAIIIAHRLSTIQHADKIVVLDQGVIVEEGSHAELLARKGLYYYLNTQQLTM